MHGKRLILFYHFRQSRTRYKSMKLFYHIVIQEAENHSDINQIKIIIIIFKKRIYFLHFYIPCLIYN